MSSGLWLVFDGCLAALAVGLGWAAVSAAELRRGVVLLIAFGLLVAVIWARLRAPDLALAEAAIGAGLSGALLLTALRETPPQPPRRYSRGFLWSINALTVVLAAVVGSGLLQVMSPSGGVRLADSVLAELPRSGVRNPVTAVLLNFRGYDTLLELAVLLAAALAVVSLGPARPAFGAAKPLLRALVHVLVPVLVVTAGYLLWTGAKAPGGAFQAGALLAAGGVLVCLSGRAPGGVARPWVLVAGVGVFVAVGLGTALSGRAFLEYPEDRAGGLILVIEAAAALSIAVTLVLAYLAGRPEEDD